MPDFIEEAKKEPLPDGAIPPQKVEVTPIEEVPVKPLPTRPEPAKEDLPRTLTKHPLLVEIDSSLPT